MTPPARPLVELANLLTDMDANCGLFEPGEAEWNAAALRAADGVIDGITKLWVGCSIECASWRDDDCDCGYCEAMNLLETYESAVTAWEKARG